MGTVVQLDASGPVLLVDWSYFVFWRFFATKKWYDSRLADVVDTTTLHGDPAFVSAFRKQMMDALQQVRARYGIPRGNVVALLDSPRATLWRTEVLPTYKANRDARRAAAPAGTLINPEFFGLSERALSDDRVSAVRVDGLEADDLAYLFREALPTRSIVMFTDDNDWGQLGGERVRVVNAGGADVAERSGSLASKIFSGDPGDNIPPVCKGCGKQTAKKLADSAELREAYFAKHPDAVAGHARNRLLIDLASVPEPYRRRFEAQVVVAVKN